MKMVCTLSPLCQQFCEEPHMGVMVMCPYNAGRVLHVIKRLVLCFVYSFNICVLECC